MIEGEIPKNEEKRLEALYSYNILDTFPEEEYDAITKIASEICDTPIALVSLIDPTRQWFKSHHGLGASETPREFAFCAHAINTPEELFIIPDATKDERFHDNPLTTDAPNVIFYAGAPLNTSDGHSLGTLCVIDTKPRKTLTQGQQESLKALAKQVVSQLELRKKNIKLEQANSEISRLNDQLNHFAYRLTHDLKSPTRGIKSLVDLIKDDHHNLFTNNDEAKEWLNLIDSRAIYMDSLIQEILNFTRITNEKIDYTEFSIDETIQNVLKNCGEDINLNLINCNQTITHSEIGFIQVIQNLLTNSKKFTNKSVCEVKLNFSEDTDYYHFIYEDNGPGIDEKYWEKVFIMFETLDENNFTNTGIGLATVMSIVKRLGGDVLLKKRENDLDGVRFDFKVSKQRFIAN